MLPEEIYASSSTASTTFKYAHPLDHRPIDDGALRARLAYDLMTFMRRSDCSYFMNPETLDRYNPHDSDDEIDLLIVDGFYKEAQYLIEENLREEPDDEKLLFQQAFLNHLKTEYTKILNREEKILKQDPRNVNALINKGFALANLNREKEALETADKALRIDPNNMIALGSKAFIAKSMGRDDLREQTLRHAYNVSARSRMEQLERDEARLLRDFGSIISKQDMPSAYSAFNARSGIRSQAVH